MHVSVRVFGIRLAYGKIRIDATVLVFHRAPVLGTDSFESGSSVGDASLGNHYDTPTAKTYAAAQSVDSAKVPNQGSAPSNARNVANGTNAPDRETDSTS